MYLKADNGVAVEYPYNPFIDYPNTIFPIGESSPELEIHWVFNTVPVYNDETHRCVEGLLPAFNTELQRWEQSWEYVELSEEEKQSKRYNDSQFMQEMIACVSFKEWIAMFPSTDRMIFFDACTNAKIDRNWSVVQSFYNGFKQVIAPSTEAINEWTGIAFSNGIPIVF